MVVKEDTCTENHEEFVDSQSESEPVFTVESILFDMCDEIGCV
jgi:hypothetical protein